MSLIGSLLARIETFCRRHGLDERAFGQRAIGDGRLVERLRQHKGTLMTVRRVEEFMAAPGCDRVVAP